MKTFLNPLLIGCGILKEETGHIIRRNGWDLDVFFLDSALHVDFEKLYSTLETVLNRFRERELLVFYGACHPCMEQLVSQYNARRLPVQNCIEALLGRELFTRELAAGAFFLLEDWVCRWDYITRKAMGDNIEGIHMIFREEHRYFLAVRTPLSGDFTAQANAIGENVGLPVKWLDVSLDHLEKVLGEAAATIENKPGSGLPDTES